MAFDAGSAFCRFVLDERALVAAALNLPVEAVPSELMPELRAILESKIRDTDFMNSLLEPTNAPSDR